MRHVSPLALRAGTIELKGDDDENAIVQKALEDLTKTIDDRLKEVDTKALTDRLDKLEAKINRPGAGEKSDDDEIGEERKAFQHYLSRGDRLPVEEVKTLRVSNDPSGGYLAPPEMQTEFIRDLVLQSPFRTVASVRTTMAPSVIYPTRTSITNARWKGEAQASESSEPSFGQTEVPVRELTNHVDISNQLLADSGGQAEAEVRLALAEDYGQKEGAGFISGDGVLAPEGVMTNAAVAYTANGHAADLKADALIILMYALPAIYRNRGSWLMNGTTLGILRKLKDGQGNFLWQPAFVAGQPETVLGRPVVEMVDMPDLQSGSFPIAFGDFNAAYRIVDRLDMSILVNPYLLATNGLTRIHSTRRVGGRVIRPTAIRKLKMVTS